ncbi:MAG: hypothetical protein LBC11_01150 [Puniceicoccales bacterium]|nr:hypothetical protein [Puniceicoccales bacterium]
MENTNRIDASDVRFPNLLRNQLRDVMAGAIVGLTPVGFRNFVNSTRSLREYDVQSMRQALGNVSFNGIVEFAKKHHFIATITVGVATIAVAPLAKLALISPIKLLCLLTNVGLGVISPAFKLILKWTALSMAARIICHMDFGQLNSITSAIARMVFDPLSVSLMKGTIILATLMFIASMPV